MSYCRFSAKSDVYVFRASDGWECCGCCIADGYSRLFGSQAALISHLMAHRAQGHKVPQEAIDALEEEARERRG